MINRNSILLAENDPSVLYTLSGILQESGFRVSTAARLEEARELLDRHEFDAVFTEVTLEREDEGLELARLAKCRPYAPVVLVDTSNPTIEKLRDIMHARVDYVLFKPFDLEEVQTALNRLIAHRADALSPA